jgi:hypothetical protein
MRLLDDEKRGGLALPRVRRGKGGRMTPLTYADVATLLRAANLPCSRSHLNGLVRAGRLTPKRWSYKTVRFDPREVARLTNGSTTKPTKPTK